MEMLKVSWQVNSQENSEVPANVSLQSIVPYYLSVYG